MSEGFHQNLENYDERIGAENFATVPKATSVRSQRRVWLPLLLFAATCYTTLKVGGPVYAGAIMATLLCHEFGHFFAGCALWRTGDSAILYSDAGVADWNDGRGDRDAAPCRRSSGDLRY